MQKRQRGRENMEKKNDFFFILCCFDVNTVKKERIDRERESVCVWEEEGECGYHPLSHHLSHIFVPFSPPPPLPPTLLSPTSLSQ